MAKVPWYRRAVTLRWFPGWLLACLACGLCAAVALEYGLGQGTWKSRLAGFGFGFGFTLVILSFTQTKSRPLDQDSGLFPPRWLRVPVIAAALFFSVYAWLEKQVLEAPPPNVSRPDYALVLLWGCAAWFGLRFLWQGADVVRAVRAGGALRHRSIFGVGLGISFIAGATAGYALVTFLWPESQFGWRRFVAWAAVVPGLLVGSAADFYVSLRKWTLMSWLLAFRLPHFQEQLRSSEANRRVQAAEAIARMGRRAALAMPDLMEAVKDESADVRSQAALALWSSHGDDPHLSARVHGLLYDSEARVRIAAAGTLVALGAAQVSEVLPALTEGLMQPDDQFADLAAVSLGRLGPAAASAVPTLRAALFDRHQPIYSALDALGTSEKRPPRSSWNH
jgi:hypothetical protein